MRIFSLAVRIALLAPVNGPKALQGASVSRQVHAAADDSNTQGGLFGAAKLEIVDFDDHRARNGD